MIHSSFQDDATIGLLSVIPALHQAFERLRRLPADAADGITQLQGTDLYVNVHGYDTKDRERCTWESHRRTADVQCCLAGGECIDWLQPPHATGGSVYDADRDFETWAAPPGTWQTVWLRPGEFVIFLPGQLHRPMIRDGSHATIRKVVAKVAARLLEPIQTVGAARTR